MFCWGNQSTYWCWGDFTFFIISFSLPNKTSWVWRTCNIFIVLKPFKWWAWTLSNETSNDGRGTISTFNPIWISSFFLFDLMLWYRCCRPCPDNLPGYFFSLEAFIHKLSFNNPASTPIIMFLVHHGRRHHRLCVVVFILLRFFYFQVFWVIWKIRFKG